MSIVVERKLPTDVNYTSLTTFNFTGSFSSGNFTYSDDISSLASGIDVKYRLKMNIATDTSFYLDSALLNYSQACNLATEKITISPNPVTDKLSVRFATTNPVNATIIIHNISGQKVYTKSQQVAGVQTVLIPMNQLNSGVYIVTVFLDDKKEAIKKLVKD